MTTLRQLFLVDQLKQAAESGDPVRLALIRDIIKQIKITQLKQVEVASDTMMLELLEKRRDQKVKELKMMDEYLDYAHQNMEASGNSAK